MDEIVAASIESKLFLIFKARLGCALVNCPFTVEN